MLFQGDFWDTWDSGEVRFCLLVSLCVCITPFYCGCRVLRMLDVGGLMVIGVLGFALQARQSRFVLIGKGLDEDALRATFEACKVQPLRFNVDDKVFAFRGDAYVAAVVIKAWDEGNFVHLAITDLVARRT